MMEKTISPHRKTVFLRCRAWNLGLASIAAQLTFGFDIFPPQDNQSGRQHPDPLILLAADITAGSLQSTYAVYPALGLLQVAQPGKIGDAGLGRLRHGDLEQLCGGHRVGQRVVADADADAEVAYPVVQP